MFLDNLTNDQLLRADLTRIALDRGVFYNQPFFQDRLSLGPRHLMYVAIGGMGTFFTHEFYQEIRSTVILDYIKERIKERGHGRFGDVIFTLEDHPYRGHRVRFAYAKSFKDPTTKYKPEPNMPMMGTYDHEILPHFMYEHFEHCSYDIDFQFIRNYLLQYSDVILKAMIKYFHPTLHSPYRRHCEEVSMRQMSAAFWSVLSTRNVIRYNFDREEMCNGTLQRDGNWDMVFPLEYIVNKCNGTNFDEGGKYYTAEVQRRHRKGDGEVLAAEFKARFGLDADFNKGKNYGFRPSIMSIINGTNS